MDSNRLLQSEPIRRENTEHTESLRFQGGVFSPKKATIKHVQKLEKLGQTPGLSH